MRKTVLRFGPLCLLTILALQSSGCATIVTGSTQQIVVTSEPEGATVRIDGDVEEHTATTPAKLTVSRKTNGYVVSIQKPGYEEHTARLNTGLNGMVFGNILFGGLIGLIIDFSSGASNSITPDVIHVDLKPQGRPSQPSRLGGLARAER